MLAQQKNNGWNGICERDLVLLDDPAEVLQFELWHNNQLEAGVETLMDKARET